MATIYKYSILVTFTHSNPNLTGSREQVSYGPMPVHVDEFRFNNSSVRILANRVKRIPDTQQDLYGKPNAINNQIHKAIEYYYITCPRLTKVSSIQITCRTKTTSYSYANANAYQQPLIYKRGEVNQWMLPPAVAHEMLQYGGNGPTYRMALSYCLRASVESNNFTIFSLLWRSFNALFRQGSHSPIDAKGLNYIERLINNNYNVLTHSNASILQYRTDFSLLRWPKFILAKISYDALQYNRRTHQNGIKTRTFLMHFWDGSINYYFEQLLARNKALSRRINLLRGTNLNTIVRHLQANSIANGLRDQDVLIILIREYAYFLRNTLFHGAVDEPNFTLGEIQEQKELKIATTWLTNIIKDLLNNHLI